MTPIDLPDTALLSAADEIDLARRIEAGVYAEHLLATAAPGGTRHRELTGVQLDGEQAWQQFYLANLRMATGVAYRWARQIGVDADDVMQECFVALGQTIMVWDYTRGTRFSTLAWQRLTFAAQQACYKLRGIVDQPQLLALDEPDPAADEIWSQVGQLGPTDAAVIKARYGFTSRRPASYRQIANQLNTSAYYVKQIEDRALAQLQESAMAVAA